jgi:hypothetical protein
MACQLYRKDGKIDKVLAENGNDSKLYTDLVEFIKKENKEELLKNIPYLQQRLSDGSILNKSDEEIALGLWSVIYTPEYQKVLQTLLKISPKLIDSNGEPLLEYFKNSFIANKARITVGNKSVTLDDDHYDFAEKVKGKANKIQQKIIEELYIYPENPLGFNEEEHIYTDVAGDDYTSTTQAIYGTSDIDPEYKIYAEYGNAFDKILQGIVLNKPYEEAVKDIDVLTDSEKRQAFNILQSYVIGLIADGSVIVTQVRLGDASSKIAGTLDLLVISPTGKIKIIDLKVSKNSINSETYSKKAYEVGKDSMIPGYKLTKKQTHSLQVGLYKRLIELRGYEVNKTLTFNIKLDVDADKNIKEIVLEPNAEVEHLPSSNRSLVNKIIDTYPSERNRVEEIKEELGLNNPATEEDFLTDDEAKPEDEELLPDDMYDKLYVKVKKAIDVLKTRKKFYEDIKDVATFKPKEQVIDKLIQLIAYMENALLENNQVGAYGKFLISTANELSEILNYINNPESKKDSQYASVLVEADKYLESYRGIVNSAGFGIKDQEKLLVNVLNLLDETKESIQDGLEEYVKNLVRSNVKTKDFTEEELDTLMKEAYDISLFDFGLSDMATSTDVLLAVTDKIAKKASFKAKDQADSIIEDIRQAGNNLLKALGLSKSNKNTYDFMKVFDENGKFTGRYVQKIGSKYWDLYWKMKRQLYDKDGERKQYIPINDPTTADPKDIKYNQELYAIKQKEREFRQAEIMGSRGATDGAYHKYTDEFKKIRDKYEEIEYVENANGEIKSFWKKKDGVSQESYNEYVLKYYDEVEYWGPEIELDGSFLGRVSLKTAKFVKHQYTEVRDVAEDGTSLIDEKYKKLMNPTTELEKAQSEYYKKWIKYQQENTAKLPQNVAIQMNGKIARVPSKSFFLKLKDEGSNMMDIVSKKLSNVFTSDVYTQQRMVDESGMIAQDIPVTFVGNLKRKERIESLKNKLKQLDKDKIDKKLSQKEYLEQKKKYREILKIEENKISADEIEEDLTENLIAYTMMAENYAVMNSIKSDLQAIEKIVDNRNYIQTDSLGNKIIKAGSKILKTDTGDPIYKRNGDALAPRRLRKWFKMVYYNDEEFNKNTVAMVAKRLQNFTSLKGVGINPFGGINNYVMARINNAIETAGALYYERSAAKRATTTYNSEYLPGIFSKMGSTSGYDKKKPGSKYEALVEEFRMIRKFQETSGKVDFMSWAYLAQEGGEYNAQSKVGVAILMSKELKNETTGETLSIYDAFDFNPNTGKLKLKDGFTLPQDDKYETINYILEVNKQIHGNYAHEDRMVIQEHWLGQLAAQFHKWVVPFYKSRFQKPQDNINLGSVEGRYRSIVSFFSYMKETEGSFIEKMEGGWKNMTDVQKKNMYKNLAEAVFLATSFAMYGVFKALASGVDDDDEKLKKLLNFLKYQQTRQINEILTMVPVLGLKEQWQMLKSPIPALTTLKDFGELSTTLFSIPFQSSEKNYYQKGIYKGELKFYKEARDVIPGLAMWNRWESFSQVSSFYIR